VESLPAAWVVGALAVLAIGAVIGGLFLFRTYQFVQHDNDFCLSCHLMVEPYERFARSGHRGLGCKACHQPTLAVRSQMALTQILERPDELHTHAEVPNERCVACHVRGDPDRWLHIGNSIGHRVHIESDRPELQGLQCVQCHSSSVHEFAATDRTCGQSGCHEDTRVRLGGMGQFTIHCIACHDFSRPVLEPLTPEARLVALQPRREECLSCHQMRILLADFPADEPHDAACGACHDPHQQTTPAQAVRTCAGAGCHSRADTLTAFHRGLDPGVLDNCTQCHAAHVFRVRGEDCLACHRDVFDDVQGAPRAELPAGHPRAGVAASRARSPGTIASAGPSADVPAAVASRYVHGAPVRLAALAVHAPRAPAPVAALQAAQALPQRDLRFRHGQHRDVECSACHRTVRTHGELVITTLRECRQCHHTQPVADRCSRCHRPADYQARPYRVTETFRLSVQQRRPRERALSFEHRTHEGVACRECHTAPLTLSAAGVTCTSCHDQHHRPSAECRSCHVEPPVAAHPPEVHVGCAGAGCHDALPAGVRNVPRTRNFCLVCHQGLVDHRPGRNCADCHELPPPRAGAALAERPLALHRSALEE
jgi:nitrate/TMAO reductase-like tetraheme cytochrome c subunit